MQMIGHALLSTNLNTLSLTCKVNLITQWLGVQIPAKFQSGKNSNIPMRERELSESNFLMAQNQDG